MADRHGSRDDIEVLLRVARMYYVQNLNQAEIASTVGYSRPYVSKLLERARRQGIVRITVSHPLERVLRLENQVSDLLGLDIVRVADVRDSDVLGVVGGVAADVLNETVRNGDIIGLGNGRTIAAMAHHLPILARPDCTVVQLLGSIEGGAPAWGRDAPTLCTLVAERLGANAARMPVPLIVDDPALLAPLMREERIATTLALGGRADIAFVGVAGTDAHGAGNILAGYLTDDVKRSLLEGGAVGHILDHHYDAEGSHVITPLTPRTMAVPFDQLRNIPLVIGVAAGPEKVNAIVAAARGGILNGLVTDVETATAIARL